MMKAMSQWGLVGLRRSVREVIGRSRAIFAPISPLPRAAPGRKVRAIAPNVVLHQEGIMSGFRATIGRRRFVQLMGWAGAAAAAQGGPALAAAAQKSKAANRAVVPSPSPSPAPPEISDEARALAEVVRRRYPDRVSAQELETITRDLDGDLKSIQRLREMKLANADEPDSTFRA
jgi:enoyl-CoA hydratase/carnithine racemase